MDEKTTIGIAGAFFETDQNDQLIASVRNQLTAFRTQIYRRTTRTY